MPLEFEDWLAQDKLFKFGYIQFYVLVSEYVLCSVIFFEWFFIRFGNFSFEIVFYTLLFALNVWENS